MRLIPILYLLERQKGLALGYSAFSLAEPRRQFRLAPRIDQSRSRLSGKGVLYGSRFGAISLDRRHAVS